MVSPEDVGTAFPVFFGQAGASFSIVFANLGAAYGIARAGTGLAAMGQMYPNEVMKNIVPVVMAGVVGIFGLIVSVLIVLAIKQPVESEGVYINKYGWDLGFKHFASGLTLGLSGVAGGYAIGVVGSDAQKFVGLRKELFVPMILIISFAGAVPLYGLIGSMILIQ